MVPAAPQFPLSSPISEEISSPLGSTSAEEEEEREDKKKEKERDFERNRPFEFLARATTSRNLFLLKDYNNNINKTNNKDTESDLTTTAATTTTTRDLDSSRQETYSYSGNKPRLTLRGIMRRSTEKPVGLNLVTNFPLPSSPRKRVDGVAAPFVDLNDLKLLSKVREKERSAQQQTHGIGIRNVFRKRATSQGSHRLSEQSAQLEAVPPLPPLSEVNPGNGKGGVRSTNNNNRGNRIEDELSPSDRRIDIGITVPVDESSISQKREKPRELECADARIPTPVTPSIVVTPAKEEAPWSDSGVENAYLQGPRTTSSVYSQPTPRFGELGSEVPPVPAIPAFHSARNGYTERTEDLLGGPPIPTTRKERTLSTGTFFEEEESPGARSYSDENNPEKALPRLSINSDTNRHRSQGWWTYLLSPILGRSDTIASRKSSPASPQPERPPMPSSSFITSSDASSEKWWDKEVSCFSPETPVTETVATSRSRMSGWQEGNNNPFFSAKGSTAGDVNNNKSILDEQQPQTTMTPFMFPEMAIPGAAAEYYQACAHELFSGTPYFECVNHVCSITPRAKVGVADSGGVATEINGNRSLVNLVEVDSPRPGNEGSRGLSLGEEEESLPSSQPGTECELTSTAIDHQKSAPSTAATKEDTVVNPPAPSKGTSPAPDTGTETTRAISEPSDPTPPVNPSEKQQTHNPPPAEAVAAAPPIINYHIRYPSAAGPPAYTTIPAERPGPHYFFYPPNHNAPPPQPQPQPQPQPPYPTSPGLQQATERGGSIPLSDMQSSSAPAQAQGPAESKRELPGALPAQSNPVPVTTADITYPAAVATTQNDRVFPDLPPHFHPAPITTTVISHPDVERKRIEARRRRLEKEDAVGKKIGGLWRGRGPFSNKGCFGRPGREGRVRRRWYIAIAMFFLLIIVLAIVLATTLTRKGDQTPVQSQWLNLTGYPPMPTGIATIAGAEPQVQNSGCISPSSLWSCALPKEQQSANAPYSANEPNFRVEVRFRNGTYSNSTNLGSSNSSPSSQMAVQARSIGDLFNPSPSPPSTDDQIFIGNTTDNNALPYSGEETPFYITILSPIQISPNLNRLARRFDDNLFPNLTALIPSPDIAPDGTAAAANLYPLPVSQPVRLYNRGQPNEYYGFYTYFDRSIFLESSAPLNGSTTDDLLNDGNGGSSKENARVRCTWSQTRFLVQIWTQPNRSGMVLLSSSGTNNNTGTGTKTASSTTTSKSPSSSSSANNFIRPGSFPYPVTITIDRHGGTAKKKLVYCYGMDSEQRINRAEKKLQIEDRGFGGNLVNPAPGIFNVSALAARDDAEDGKGSVWSGGIDGGTGGCGCQWRNWVSRS